MGKDPAFLFYSQAWLEGTAEMEPEERGAYIDLMAHQHQRGSLPNNPKKLAKLARMELAAFEVVWAETLSAKFVEVEPGKLINLKLSSVVKERNDLGHKNAIIGKFAALCRKADLPKEQYKALKEMFKIDDFLPFSTAEATERLTETFTGWLTLLKDKDTITDTVKDELNKGVPGNYSHKNPKWEDFMAECHRINNDSRKPIPKGAIDHFAGILFQAYEEAAKLHPSGVWRDSQGTPVVETWKGKIPHKLTGWGTEWDKLQKQNNYSGKDDHPGITIENGRRKFDPSKK